MKAIVMGSAADDGAKYGIACALAHKESHDNSVHIQRAESKKDLKELSGHKSWIIVALGYIQFSHESIEEYCKDGDEVQMIYVQPITIKKEPPVRTEYKLNYSYEKEGSAKMHQCVCNDYKENRFTFSSLDLTEHWSGTYEEAIDLFKVLK